MFSNIKVKISELAYAAVSMAEETLESASGKEKKAAAVEYVVSMLPIIAPLKSIVCVVLSRFIDEAIERAVEYMKNIKNSEAKI